MVGMHTILNICLKMLDNLSQDQQILHKLKEKKESNYNALLEKV
jgi:hypothetical protein